MDEKSGGNGHMMSECPRCGFIQPKDRYCANCGLNFEKFRPRPQSLGETILKNPIFHLVLAAAVILGTISYIYVQRKPRLGDEPVQEVASSPPIEAISEAPNPEPPSPSAPPPPSPSRYRQRNVEEPPSDINRPSGSLQPTSTVSQQERNESVTATDRNKPSKFLKMPERVALRFASWPRDIERSLFSESQVIDSGEGYMITSIPWTQNLDGLQQRVPQMEFLPGGGTRSLTLGAQVQLGFHNISPEGNQEAEFQIGLIPAEWNTPSLTLDLNVVILIRTTNLPDSWTFNLSQRVPTTVKQFLALSIDLPPLTFNEGFRDLVRGTSLEILLQEEPREPAHSLGFLIQLNQ